MPNIIPPVDSATYLFPDPTMVALDARYAKAAAKLVYNVKDYGAVGDGTADDTAAINAAISAAGTNGSVWLPAGTYLYASGVLPSGLHMAGAGANLTTIKMHPSVSGANVRMFDLSNTSDITLEAMALDGNLSAFTAVVTEQKHAIYASGVTRLRLRNMRITNCKGDGLYIGKGIGHSVAVDAVGLRCDGNWRNNLTVADLIDGKFVDCNFDGATGTAPMAGVDIEPNDNTYSVSDVRFIGCTFNNNAGYGIANTFYPGGQIQQRVRFVGCTVSGNGTGVYLYGSTALSFTDCDIIGSTLDGVIFQSGAISNINFHGGRIALNGHQGIDCQPLTGSTVKNVKIIGTTIVDNGATTPNTYYGMLWDIVGGLAGSVDGLTILGVTSTNTATSNQKYGGYFSAAVSNLTLNNNDFRGNATAAAVLNDDVTTRYRGRNGGTSDEVNGNVSQTIPSTARSVVGKPSTAALTFTLPAAPEPMRPYLIFDQTGTAATYSITIVPSVNDVWALGTNAVISTNGGFVSAYYYAGKWYR